METANERLAQVRTALGFHKKADFAAHAGIERSSYDKMEKGPHKPSADNLERILSRFPAINLNWLLMGIGPMLHGDLPIEPRPDYTTAAGTVAEASALVQLARAEATLEQLETRLMEKDETISWLREQLGKPFDSPDAADHFLAMPVPPVPRRPMGFGAAVHLALRASYAGQRKTVAALS